MTSDYWIRAKALRAIARKGGITFTDAKRRFNKRLVSVQCNVVTAESVQRVLDGMEQS